MTEEVTAGRDSYCETDPRMPVCSIDGKGCAVTGVVGAATGALGAAVAAAGIDDVVATGA